MNSHEVDRPIGEIETDWGDIFLAHFGERDRARAAQCRLMYRYMGAVRRYFLGALRDPDLADELAQEFAVRVLRGDFHRADPGRGRFRDFVRTAARNLIHDHFRRLKGRPRPLPLEDREAIDPKVEGEPLDAQFLEVWREQLFQRAWSSLAAHQRRTGRPFHTVLALRAESPEATSMRLAEVVSTRIGLSVTASWVRQTLRQARRLLVDFLLDEIDSTLDGKSAAELEQELIDLDLLSYCRDGLRRRALRSPQPDRPGPTAARTRSGEQQDTEP
ncbi:MAG TPA: sigma factor [Isosphaeraceae bacterium]|jgi:RNA polymerase sigma-70 factor (ECF subfamily)|nr:sigma factor [Isosphaeraceae bacterium]